MKHLVALQDLEVEEIAEIMQEARRMVNHKRGDTPLAGYGIATLFYEPSTRTRLSFEAAMKKLGGHVSGTENAHEFSSAAKGETLPDTIRTVACYVDAIVLRHNVEGSAEIAARVSKVPIINAGDGPGQHPSQALLDLYTMENELRGKIDGTTITMVGDLQNGRTVRSLCYLLGKYKGIKIIFISPENLRMKEDIKEYLRRHDVHFEEQTDLDAHLPQTDIVYMTRTQKERMTPEDAAKPNMYSITEANLHLLQPHARLMHPLPHVEEINLSEEIEGTDPRVAYFRQVQNGLHVRMAILKMLIR